MKISIIINADTRNENSSADTMFNGTVNLDFITDGVIQKKKFFDGFDIETILYIDVHNPLEQKTIDYLSKIVDILVLRKHTDEHSFNDWNYIRALQLATGDIVCHFDQDSNAYSDSKGNVQELIGLLDTYSYVSYPSHWTPNAVEDASFNYKWVSTRFFICKRETLNFTEIEKCLTDYEYFCEKYKPSRACHWMEHFLGLISNSDVYYPPIQLDKIIIFSWGSYDKYTLQRLNNFTYEQVKDFVKSKGIAYPNDIYC